MSTGTCRSVATAGLRASLDGGHEEVDGAASEERTGIFSAAAPHDWPGGEAGPTSG